MVEPGIYTVGGTVQTNEQGLYIPRPADAELLTLCQQAEFSYVLTPRQMGKSSLMIRTAEQLLDAGWQVVIIDLALIGTQLTVEQWYRGLLDPIASDLSLSVSVDDWWQAHQHLGVTQRFTQFLQQVVLGEVSAPVVIFVDEIDTSLSLDFTDDFFVAVRSLYVARANEPELRRLSFVLIGVAMPGDLIRDSQRTPFNIGHRVDLTDFTLAEAMPLAAGLGLPSAQAEQALGWVLKWTGGHPYLTQRLCQEMVRVGGNSWSEMEVDRLVTRTFLGEQSEQDNNLQFVRDMLTKRAPEPVAVLKTYREIRRGKRPVVDEEQSLVKSHLKLSGVVRREGRVLQIRNQIYRQVFDWQWIKTHLPETLWQKLKSVLPEVALPLAAILLVTAVVMAFLFMDAQIQRAKAEDASQQAQAQAELAQKNATDAQEQRAKAEEAFRQANKDAENAQKSAAEAAKQRRIAEEAFKLAKQQTVIAQRNAAEAQRQRNEATRQRQIADAQRQIAEDRRVEADGQRQIAELQRDDATKAKDALAILSESSGLSAQALAVRDTFPQRSLLMAVEAIKKNPEFRITEATALLRRLLLEIGGIPLVGHEKPVVAVVFSSDGHWLATGSQDSTVRLWDKLNPDKPAIVLQGHLGEVKAIALSPDGKWLAATGEDTKIQLWNLTSSRVNSESLTLQGHTAAINTLSFSLDGTWLATGSEDKTVRLWSMKTPVPGAQQILLGGHGDSVRQVAFSRSGHWLATSEGNSGNYRKRPLDIRLWDMRTISNASIPTILKTQPYIENILAGLAFSPDEKHLAAAISSSVQVWNLTANNLSNTSSTIIGSNNGWINALAFSPDSRWLATGISDLKLWDLRSLDPAQPRSPDCQTDSGYSVCRFFLRGHTAYISSLKFSPDGKWLASSSTDNTARLWDITDLSIPPVVLRGHEDSVNEVAFDPEGQWLATAGQDTQVRLWKVPDVSADPTVYRGTQDGVAAVALSPEWVAVAGGDRIIRLWSRTEPLRPPILLIGHNNVIYHVAFAPNGKWLASASVDGTVRLWNMTEPSAPSHNLTGPSFWSMAFSSSGRWLAAGSYDGTVRLWDMHSPSLPTEPSHILDTQNRGVRSLAFSPDEHRLATGGNVCTDRNTIVWDLTLKNPNINPSLFPGNCDVVADVVFSPDSRWMATAGWDGKARLWDLTIANSAANSKVIEFTDPVSRVASVAFSPDGHWLVAGSWNKQVQLQDMTQLTQSPYKLLGHQGSVFNVQFSPDGQWLATASADQTIRLWNPKELQAAPIILRGHDSLVNSLAFSADSHWLLSGGNASNDARLWRVNEDELITVTCRTAGRNFTPEEWQQFLPGQPYHQTCPDLPS